MNKMITREEALSIVAEKRPQLVAIDGLSCSGKSTLAGLVSDNLGYDILGIDDFNLPAEQWPADISPQFPFPFVRYNEFIQTVRTLAETGKCSYNPFDWHNMRIDPNPRLLSISTGVVIEGVSVLHQELSALYDLKLFVESDEETLLDTVIKRDGDRWINEWQTLFIPSTKIYMQQQPKLRADYIVMGRGL